MTTALPAGDPLVRLELDGPVPATGLPPPAFFCAAVALALARYGPGDTVRFVAGTGSPARPGVVELAWHPAAPVRDLVERIADALTAPAHPPEPGALGGGGVLGGDGGRVFAVVVARAEALPPHEDVLVRGDADVLLALCADTGLAVRVRRGTVPVRLVLGFARHVLATLAGMPGALDLPPARCPMLGAAERTALLAAAAGPHVGYPLGTGLRRLFEQVAATLPHAVAITGEDGDGTRVTVTYEELDRWADAVAAALLRLGAGPGTPVVVCLPSGPAAVAALLGTVKIGATYVPADAGHPPAYLGRIVENVAPAVVATDDRTAGRIRGHVGATALLTVRRPAAGDHVEKPPDPAGPGLLIFHTSGSTGPPKSVTHRQHQVLNRLYWMWETHPFGEREVMCQRSPLGVMPVMWELLGGLLHGVPTVLAPDSVTRDPARLARFVAEHAITRMTMPPSVFAALAAVPDARSLLATLRHVTIGGELLPPGFAAAFHEVVPAATMIEDYGCTETNTILHRTLRPGDTELPSGRPIANLAAYVLDRYGEPAPPGAIGELAVAGVPLAVTCSDAGAGRFVPNDLDPATGPVLYRTGDLARVGPDHSVTLVGRADHQLKIQGRRVEPAEVEGVLMAHPAVTACAVTKADAELVAVAVAAPSRDLPAELVAFAADRLPPFMVPTRVRLVPELPRLPGGKLDRRAVARLATRPGDAVVRRAGAGPVAQVRGVLAELLGRDLDESTDTTEFHRHGMSSLHIVEYARRLSERLGLAVTPAALYEHFTVEDLAAHLAAHLAGRSGPVPDPARRDAADGVAIIGIACRFPAADTPDRFWSLLAGGHCAVKPIPPERIDPGLLGDGWRAALLDEVADFDPAFFGIAPADAALLDPQIRIGLEESWRAFEDAGYAPASLSAGQTGVFVGMRRGDLGPLLDRAGMAPSATGLLGTSPAMLGARIAAHLDLSGPAVTVDTACSSSLTAVHLAARALVDGECDLALAGGVHLVLSHDFLLATRELGILSPSGRCRAFDRDADGTVQGEGAGFVVLKRVADALRDGDDIRAVIIGSGLGANGRANGLGAPNPRAQADLQQRVHRRFGIDPATIGYVEAHGTGTSIGDPIEVAALTSAFGATATRPHCGIGSVKANIGHLNEAAGIAGLIKATLCLRHQRLPPSVGVETPCSGLTDPGSPFYLVPQLERWRTGTPRRAAVNSFGLSGTNVHCVLEEAPPRHRPTRSRPPACLFLLSAGTTTALAALTRRFREWVVGAGRDHDLLDISFTLLTGRARHRKSTWAVAATHDELAETLTGVAAGAGIDPDPPGHARAVLATLTGGGLDDEGYRHALTELGALLAATPALDVAGLFPREQVRRVPVPTYRFDRQRCWPALLGPPDSVPAGSPAVPNGRSSVVQDGSLPVVSGGRSSAVRDGSSSVVSGGTSSAVRDGSFVRCVGRVVVCRAGRVVVRRGGTGSPAMPDGSSSAVRDGSSSAVSAGRPSAVPAGSPSARRDGSSSAVPAGGRPLRWAGRPLCRLGVRPPCRTGRRPPCRAGRRPSCRAGRRSRCCFVRSSPHSGCRRAAWPAKPTSPTSAATRWRPPGSSPGSRRRWTSRCRSGS